MDILYINKNERIIVEGREINNVYFIVSGRFETTKSLILYQQTGISSLESKINVSYQHQIIINLAIC